MNAPAPALVACTLVLSACGPLAPAADLPSNLDQFLAMDEGWKPLFDGKSLDGWKGDTAGYAVEDGTITCTPDGSILMTAEQFDDFVLDFEFKLAAGSNNGIGIRYPGQGDPAYAGMEIQVLDDTAEKYAGLKDWQFHGSIYGLAAAERGHLKPVGEWNRQQIVCVGDHVRVVLNGHTIVDADLSTAEPAHDRDHPGIENETGHIALCGHGDFVAFRNLRAYPVPEAPPLPDTETDNTPPPGFTALFNGDDLSGWQGLVADPIKRAEMSEDELARAQEEADQRMRQHWSAEDGEIRFDGKGENLCTIKDYGDFECYIDWKIPANADSGIYIRGTPQIQIWDPANEDQWKHGADMGSGALWNNKKAGNRPLVKADNPIGEWNTFLIRMIDQKVSIWLNGKLVLDDVVLENYWAPDQPAFRNGPIELQNHGQPLFFKNLYVREIPF